MTLPTATGLALSKEDGEFPLPSELRSTIVRIVDAFVAGDFQLRDHEIEGLLPINAEVAHQMASYVRDYGDVLVPMDEAVWRRSVYCWAESRWDVMVDLTTSQEAVSDLVLFLSISPEPHLIEVRSVHVP